jgi:hypothetical protein
MQRRKEKARAPWDRQEPFAGRMRKLREEMTYSCGECGSMEIDVEQK